MHACTSTSVKLFWAAVNAVKLLNLTVIEPFVNDVAILTASMGTFEQYRSRKRRMLYPALSHVQWGWILTMS